MTEIATAHNYWSMANGGRNLGNGGGSSESKNGNFFIIIYYFFYAKLTIKVQSVP